MPEEQKVCLCLPGSADRAVQAVFHVVGVAVCAEDPRAAGVEYLPNRRVRAEIAVATHRIERHLREQRAHLLDVALAVAEEDHRVRRAVALQRLAHVQRHAVGIRKNQKLHCFFPFIFSAPRAYPVRKNETKGANTFE